LRRCEVLDKPEFDFIDLDHALEWIEARTLNEFSGVPTEASLRKMLVPHFRPQNLERLLFLLEPPTPFALAGTFPVRLICCATILVCHASSA